MMLSEDESEKFWKHFQLVMRTVSEFFMNTYYLQVTGIDKDKLQCNVLSVEALDKFRNDVDNGSARISLEKALDLCETDPYIVLELSARDYCVAKEFLVKADSTKSQQM